MLFCSNVEFIECSIFEDLPEVNLQNMNTQERWRKVSVSCEVCFGVVICVKELRN